MKCELCHKNEAAVALPTGKGDDDELYVCKECAKRERVRRQKKSQRTRKVTGLPPGMSMSVTEVSGDDVPPPIIEALMGLADELERHTNELERQLGKTSESNTDDEGPRDETDDGATDGNADEQKPRYHTLPCERADEAFRIGSRLHLEGLHIIGELEAVHRAMTALNMRLVGVDADGVRETGHVYEVDYLGSSERAKRVVEALLAQERNARKRLVDESPRVFGDTLCRALAMLKNCRLLSPGELFDLLSPLQLAARENMLDGITLGELRKLATHIDLDSKEDILSPDERDQVDASRADEINERFEDVMLNERGEEKFL